jgi:hypothetical protein
MKPPAAFKFELEDALKSIVKSTFVGGGGVGVAFGPSALLEQPPIQFIKRRLAAPKPTCEINSFLSMVLFLRLIVLLNVEIIIPDHLLISKSSLIIIIDKLIEIRESSEFSCLLLRSAKNIFFENDVEFKVLS